MSTQENVQTVKNFFAAMGRGDKPGLLALSAADIEWIAPVRRRSCGQRLEFFDGHFGHKMSSPYFSPHKNVGS
ncbi:nuclear transport factor 2 family protein [Pseudomonas sp. LB3P58]